MHAQLWTAWEHCCLSLLTSNTAVLAWPLSWHQKYLALRFQAHGEFLKDVNGAPTQKVTSRTLIHHLPVVQQNGCVVLSQNPRWWCPDCSSQHSADLLSCFYFWFSSLYIKISLFPSCPLHAVVFYHICHPMAELFIHGIRLIDSCFFSILGFLKLLLLTDLSLGTLASDHLCALPVKMLGWIHYPFTRPNEFLFLGVMRWHTCAVFQASLEFL